MANTERVIVLVDMDCFYCQVEEKLNPELEGKPIAVVQYNAWRGGGIIAVNYPARDRGVTRHMRGDEAKQKCPDIVLARVPQVRGKADLTKYRDAGKKVAEVLQTFTNLLERASVDEAYLDITEEVKKRLEQGLDQIKIEKLANTFVVGCDTEYFINSLKDNREFSESNIRLAIGGIITEEIRAEILNRTGYKCSAGVAHNKILAKLVCGLHKPNKQTLLPQNAVAELYKDLPIKKIKSLGGKFGSALAEELQITYMGELAKFSEKELAKKFDEKNAKWLYNIARGIDLEPVTVRLVSKSIGCCKRFPGRTALITAKDVEHWINELASEISERLCKDLEENNRRAKQMVVSFTQETNERDVSSSRTHPLQSYEQAKIARSALDVIRRFCMRADGSYCITFLGISVGNFQDLKNSMDISSIFKNMNERETHTPKPALKDDKPKSITSFFQNLAEKTKDLNINPPSETAEARESSLPDPKINTPKTFFQSWVSRCQEPTNPNNRVSKISNEEKIVYDASAPSPERNETVHQNMVEENLLPINTKDNAEEPRSIENQIKGTTIQIHNMEPNDNERDKMQSNENAKDKKESNEKELNEIITKSFFLRYFMNEGKHLLKPNINIIEFAKSVDPSFKYEEPPLAGTSRQEDKSPDLQPLPFDDNEICPECNKKIPSSEYLSHLDYHFALKLVKDEAHLYEEPKDSNEKGFKKNINKSKGESKEPGRVLMLLQKNIKQDMDETNSEICAECNQKVRISDLGRHFDQHDEEKMAKARMMSSKEELGSNLQKMELDLEEPDDPYDISKNAPSTSKILDEDTDLFSDNSPLEKDNFFATKGNQDELDNLSVYSADTEDLNEDTKNLIYFEDVFSESDSSQPLFSSQEKIDVAAKKKHVNEDVNRFKEDSSRTSCYKDAFLNFDLNRSLKEPDIEEPDLNEEKNEPKATTKSLFGDNRRTLLKQNTKVKVEMEDDFQKPTEILMVPNGTTNGNQPFLKEPDKEKSLSSKPGIVNEGRNEHKENTKRTTKTFHNYVNDQRKFLKPDAIEVEEMDDFKPKEPKENVILMSNGTKSRTLDGTNIRRRIDGDDKQNCPECSKKVPLSDLFSHMDYHFALKMVKDEAYLYRNPAGSSEEITTKNNNKKSKPSQTSKRKQSESKKLETFLQKTNVEDLDESNSELCRECNKRIKLDETVGHADYHAAKKLHSEINSPKKVMTTSVRVKNKKNKSVMNLRTISNFFKA